MLYIDSKQWSLPAKRARRIHKGHLTRSGHLPRSKRGGKRQRVAALEALQKLDAEEGGSSSSAPAGIRATRFDSHQGRSLVKAWAWGDKQATEVQRSARDAYKDQQELLGRGNLHPDLGSRMLKELASIGNWGGKYATRELELEDIPRRTRHARGASI